MVRIATFNANSIRARLDQILAWLATEQPDILAVQETKVQDQEFPAQPIAEAGYHVVCRGQKAHAGVALISKSEPQDVQAGLDDTGEPDEPRLIRAVIDGLTVINTYVPQGRSVDSPHFAYKLEWLGRLRAYLERHFAPDEPLVWLGDMNVAPEEIDVYDPKRLSKHVDFHPDARRALQEVVEWGLVDLFRALHPDEPGYYTYWDYRVAGALERNMGWRVDHILGTEPIARRCVRAWIDVEARRAERPSDHTFLVVELEAD